MMNVKTQIYNVLCQLNLDPSLSGFEYAIELGDFLHTQLADAKHIMKGYAYVAEKYNKNVMQIERSIRHLIKSCNGDSELSQKLFPTRNKSGNITPSRFIYGILLYIKYNA